jgi:hypothetical protein
MAASIMKGAAMKKLMIGIGVVCVAVAMIMLSGCAKKEEPPAAEAAVEEAAEEAAPAAEAAVEEAAEEAAPAAAE